MKSAKLPKPPSVATIDPHLRRRDRNERRSHRLADGTPAFGFRGLLTHLATIERNTMRRRDAEPGEGTFILTTRPNSKQQQALAVAAAIAV
jgi:hypothetical protein